MDKIIGMLEEVGVPFAYSHFAEGESPDPPFVCYLLPRSDNFSADGTAYHKLSVVHFEIYTDKKDRPLECRVEDVLDKNNIFYNKSEVWIDSEKLYEVIYTFEKEVENYAE